MTTTPFINLSLPLSPDTARSLQLGQMVTLSGLVFTGRSRFHIRAVEQDIVPPIDFEKINAFFHVGPVMGGDSNNWRPISAEPTSSIRFERYGPDVVRRFNVRTLIGKTTMGPTTTAALQAVGGVYLSKIGLCGNQLAGQVKRVVAVHFLEELGKTEATWVFDVKSFGPFFVAIDAHGNNYFKDLERDIANRMSSIKQALGIPDDFQLTNVNPRQDNHAG